MEKISIYSAALLIIFKGITAAQAVDADSPYSAGDFKFMGQTNCRSNCEKTTKGDPGMLHVCQALVTLMNDPRCQAIESASVVQLYANRGIEMAPPKDQVPPCNIKIGDGKSQTSGSIGGGDIHLTLKSGKEAVLHWDAGHQFGAASESNVDEWLFGRKFDISNIKSVGFYQQLMAVPKGSDAAPVCRVLPVNPPTELTQEQKETVANLADCSFVGTAGRVVNVNSEGNLVDKNSSDSQAVCVGYLTCHGSKPAKTVCAPEYCPNANACARDRAYSVGTDITRPELDRAVNGKLGDPVIGISGGAPAASDSSATKPGI